MRKSNAQAPSCSRFWERWAGVFYVSALIALASVLFFGVEAKGATRWLNLGFARFQPSEIAKIAVPMMVSAYLSRRFIPPKLKHVAGALLIIAIPAFLIIRQPDLGTSILVFASGFFSQVESTPHKHDIDAVAAGVEREGR